jgi:hypothetical protein
VLADAPLADLRLALNQNQPLGDDRFYAEIEAVTGQRREPRKRGRPKKEAPEETRRDNQQQELQEIEPGPNGANFSELTCQIIHLSAPMATYPCFLGWPFSRTSSRASRRGLVMSGNVLRRRLRWRGLDAPGSETLYGN